MATNDDKKIEEKQVSENVLFIKKRLVLFGINKQSYEAHTGNLVGKLRVPTQLLIYNRKLTPEDAFYLVAMKVFEAASLFCSSVPRKFKKNWLEVVGEEIYTIFQRAIFEEINQRFLSNSFPEFQNQSTFVPANMQIFSRGSAGGSSLSDYLNAVTKSMLTSVDWTKINPDDQNKIFDKTELKHLLVDMSNLQIERTTKDQLLLANPDGTFFHVNSDVYAAANEIPKLEKKITDNTENFNHLNSDFLRFKNQYDEDRREDLTKQILPKLSVFSSAKNYQLGEVVYYRPVSSEKGDIFVSLQENNMDHIPQTSPDYWGLVTQAFANNEGDLVYDAGTDIKLAFVKPGPNYISVFNLKNCQNKDDVLNQIRQEIPTFSESQNTIFCTNFFNQQNPTNIQISSRVQLVLNLFFGNPNAVTFFQKFSTVDDLTSGDNLMTWIQLSNYENTYLKMSNFDAKQAWFGGTNFIAKGNLPDTRYDLTHNHFLSTSADVGGYTNSTNFDNNLILKTWSLKVNKEESAKSAWPPYERKTSPGWSSYEAKSANYSGFVEYCWTTSFSWLEWSPNLTNNSTGLYQINGTNHRHYFSTSADVKGYVDNWHYTLNLNSQTQTEFQPKFTAIYCASVHPTENGYKCLYVNVVPVHDFTNLKNINLSGYLKADQTISEIQKCVNSSFQNVLPNHFLTTDLNKNSYGIFGFKTDADGGGFFEFKNVKNNLQKVQNEMQTFADQLPNLATKNYVSQTFQTEINKIEVLENVAKLVAQLLKEKGD